MQVVVGDCMRRIAMRSALDHTRNAALFNLLPSCPLCCTVCAACAAYLLLSCSSLQTAQCWIVTNGSPLSANHRFCIARNVCSIIMQTESCDLQPTVLWMCFVPCSCRHARGSDWSWSHRPVHGPEHLWAVPCSRQSSDHWSVRRPFHSAHYKWWSCWPLAAIPLRWRKGSGNVRDVFCIPHLTVCTKWPPV